MCGVNRMKQENEMAPWKEWVLTALAAGQTTRSISAELYELYGVRKSHVVVWRIGQKNPEKVAAKREGLLQREPYCSQEARIALRGRRIRHLEGLVGAVVTTDYPKVELTINALADSIAKELGAIQSGNRQTNITNVNTGPEKDYLEIHRDRQATRRKALEGE